MAYIAITKYSDRILVSGHVDYEDSKNDEAIRHLAINFAKSFSNFRSYIGQQFLIERLIAPQDDEEETTGGSGSTSERKLQGNIGIKVTSLVSDEDINDGVEEDGANQISKAQD